MRDADELTIARFPRSEVLAGIAKLWATQYREDDGRWLKPCQLGDTAAIYDRLRAIPHGSSRDAYDAVLGNKSWSVFRCDWCRTDVDVLVELVRSDNGENTRICETCARRVLDEFSGKCEHCGNPLARHPIHVCGPRFGVIRCGSRERPTPAADLAPIGG